MDIFKIASTLEAQGMVLESSRAVLYEAIEQFPLAHEVGKIDNNVLVLRNDHINKLLHAIEVLLLGVEKSINQSVKELLKLNKEGEEHERKD